MAVAEIDDTLGRFAAGSASAEKVFQTLKTAVGKDAAFDVFPDVIGSLPRGEKKSALNAWFQSQAN